MNSSGETLLRFYSKEREEWLNTAMAMPPILVQRWVFKVDAELLIARLKKQKKLNAELELDSFYVPTPIQEKREDIPYVPRMTILANREQGVLLDQHMAQPGNELENIAFRMLADFIAEHGSPSAIYVRDDRMACLLEDICAKIAVPLVVGQPMPAVDVFFEGMPSFMG